MGVFGLWVIGTIIWHAKGAAAFEPFDDDELMALLTEWKAALAAPAEKPAPLLIEHALKYFLVEATKRNGFDLQMKHRGPQGGGRGGGQSVA